MVLTGDPQTDWVIFFIGYVALLGFACYWLRYFRLAREGVRRVLTMMATAGIVFCICMIVMTGAHYRPDAVAPLAAVIGLAVAVFITEERSRHIPASVRRKGATDCRILAWVHW